MFESQDIFWNAALCDYKRKYYIGAYDFQQGYYKDV